MAAKSLAADARGESGEVAKEKSTGESVKSDAPCPVDEAASRPLRSSVPESSVSSAASCSLVKDTPEEVVLSCGDREYRVRGLSKNTGIETLRVSLRVAFNGRWHLDTLDFCQARERGNYIEAAASETTHKPDLLRRAWGACSFRPSAFRWLRTQAPHGRERRTWPDCTQRRSTRILNMSVSG
jgi:hypothetical protein